LRLADLITGLFLFIVFQILTSSYTTKGGGRRGWVNVDHPTNPQTLKPPPPETDAWKRNETQIQVLIAAFRDDLCGKTLFNMFTKVEMKKMLSVYIYASFSFSFIYLCKTQ
jgi:hypothetical protein